MTDPKHTLPPRLWQSYLGDREFRTFRHVANSLRWSFVAGFDRARGQWRVLSSDEPQGASVVMRIACSTARAILETMQQECDRLEAAGWTWLLHAPAAPPGQAGGSRQGLGLQTERRTLRAKEKRDE